MKVKNHQIQVLILLTMFLFANTMYSQPTNLTSPPIDSTKTETIITYVLYGVYLLFLIFLAYKKKGQLVIKDDIVLYNALKRPLEGKWSYSVKWSKYKNDTTKKVFSDGEAFFLWNSNNENFGYEICIGYEISKNESNAMPFVVAFLTGKWETDKMGLPLKKEFHLKYKKRIGMPGHTEIGTNEVTFHNARYEYQDNRVFEITAEYKFDVSEGKVTFRKL